MLARYDLEALRHSLRKEDLVGRTASLWRYAELLPVEEPAQAVTLGEGMTPLIELPRLSASLGLRQLCIKDEGRNPTGTFKPRGASVGVTRARELQAKKVALASSGSAATAWSTYGARARLDVVVVLQPNAPTCFEIESVLAGALVIRAPEGGPKTARDIIKDGVEEEEWVDVTAMAEPHRIEGKKTIAFELAEQMEWHLPDFIIHPTGAGLGLVAMAKAFDELEAIGWIDSTRPHLVAAQSTAATPVVDAMGPRRVGQRRARPGESTSIAGNLVVRRPLGLNLVVNAIKQTRGLAVAVNDDEIIDWIAATAKAEGFLLGPEGGAALAATATLVADGRIAPDARVVILNTSSFSRYANTLAGTLAEGVHSEKSEYLRSLLRITDDFPSSNRVKEVYS